jgi:hypothetical protein
MMSWNTIHLQAGIASLLMLSGCSVAMALHGNQEPNFDAFEVGSTRKQVEIQLGTPSSTISKTDGTKEDTYKYEIGNSPNGARATLYFYYDLFTIGLAEVIFTPIELFQGHDEETKIVYSSDDRVLDIKGYTPAPPSPELKAALEAQAQHTKRPATAAEPPPAPASENQSVATRPH